MDDVWAIVLAAGASTRMKKQKMLLSFEGKTIIETVIYNISRSIKNIVVVLGSHRYEIFQYIEDLPVKIGINESYMNGMLSSVICGFNSLPDQAKAAMIVLGDQPQIISEVARQVVDAWQKSGKGIVIPTFNGRRGHPSLIETKYKKDIATLDPEKGLRSLFEKFDEDIFEVECYSPEILRDIDTPEDYQFETNQKQQI